MKLARLSLLASVGVAVAGGSGHGGHGKPGGKLLVTSKSYQATISGKNLMKHARNLSRFSQIKGANTRAFGTIGHNATVQYIKSSLDRTGYYDTQLQTFQYFYSDGTATFSAAGTKYDAAWFTYGPGGDANAPLVIVNNLGCSLVCAPLPCNLFRNSLFSLG